MEEDLYYTDFWAYLEKTAPMLDEELERHEIADQIDRESFAQKLSDGTIFYNSDHNLKLHHNQNQECP